MPWYKGPTHRNHLANKSEHVREVEMENFHRYVGQLLAPPSVYMLAVILWVELGAEWLFLLPHKLG